MATKVINLKAFFFRSKALITKMVSQFSPPLPWKFSAISPNSNNNNNNNNISSRAKFQTFSSLMSLNQTEKDFSSQALLFHLEGAVLRPCSLFPYFMLVAFEAGGLLRALVLFLMYPFVLLAGEEFGLKIMVFVSFFGIKKKNFRVGRAVLPKFFLGDTGSEGLDAVSRFKRKIGVTSLPRVMVESFMSDFLGVDAVLGRELTVVCGYFVGLMEEEEKKKKRESIDMVLNDVFGEERHDSWLIGLSGFRKSLDQHLLSHCKVVYLVSESEKKSWEVLPREKYPKPLIFHDGRLAFKPNFTSTLVMFMWLPFGIFLFITRLTVVMYLPHTLSIPILYFTGMTGTSTTHRPKETTTTQNTSNNHGTLYVCNHRTLIDPVYISMVTAKPLVAVTYSLSKISELISPIRTVRLTRNRDEDSAMMEKLLRKSDLVVCPEGTTCREPYLLRFSPLFAELTDEIVPVALEYHVSMFYGTTAGGLKFMDPIFLLLNPRTCCNVKVLERLPREKSCGVGGKSRFEVANYVQSRIGEALGFECTDLTRKDKYIILAGNEGKV